MRQVVVVVHRGRYVQPPCEEVALAVFQRGGEGVAVAVLLPEHDFLPHACLYFLVEVGVGESHCQVVGPRLVRHADFAAHGFVVETVVEPPHPVNAVLVRVFRDAVVAENGYVVVNGVVVVGEVLEGVGLIEPAFGERLPEADVGLVGVERAVGV